MQRVKLPERINPVRAAQKQARFDGVYLHRVLTRLRDVTIPEGELHVILACEQDEQGLVVLHCQLDTELQVVCQRCNQPFRIRVERNVDYFPVSNDAERDLPEYYEAALVDEQGEINFLELVEDELLLALPIVPMHDESGCQRSASDMSFGTIDDTEEARPNPFSVLEKLKKE